MHDAWLTDIWAAVTLVERAQMSLLVSSMCGYSYRPTFFRLASSSLFFPVMYRKYHISINVHDIAHFTIPKLLHAST